MIEAYWIGINFALSGSSDIGKISGQFDAFSTVPRATKLGQPLHEHLRFPVWITI